MSSLKNDTSDEEEPTEMLMRAMTEKNVKKIENALAKTKKHGKGFVLSSHFYKAKPRRSTPKEKRRQVQPCMPIVIGSPIGSPIPTRKQRKKYNKSFPSRTKSAEVRRANQEFVKDSHRPKSAYLTEYNPPSTRVDIAMQSDEPVDPPLTPPASPEPPPDETHISENQSPPEHEIQPIEESGTQVLEPDTQLLETDTQILETDTQIQESDTQVLESEVKEISAEDEEKENVTTSPTESSLTRRDQPSGEEALDSGNEKRISYGKFYKLGLAKRPPQFQYQTKMPQAYCEKNPENPEPVHSYIWFAKVSKCGGEVNSPFYMQLDVPYGALRNDVIMKFECQSYKNSKLALSESDKLCSDLVDVDMNPMAYCLHQRITVRLRIQDDCINKYDDVTVVSARHFQWVRRPTRIEKATVNGDVIYYAVTKTQTLGKFAVITTKKMDRFVMTTAGGVFNSTSIPGVSLKVNEGILSNLPHLVELSMQETREEAMRDLNETTRTEKEITGHLVACSPIITISKEIMGRTTLLDDGVTLPEDIQITLPVTTVFKKAGEPAFPWKEPIIKVLQKTWMRNDDNKENSRLEYWTDISHKIISDSSPLHIQSGDSLPINISVPSQVVMLIFENWSELDDAVEIGDICKELQQANCIYDVSVMVHQQTINPAIISVHVIPSKAIGIMTNAMKESGEWKKLGDESTSVKMKERGYLRIHFRGDIKLTINQMDPEIAFHSRRWKGHQYQIEATNDGYSRCNNDVIDGVIEFTHSDNEDKIVYSTNITLPHTNAKPYHPTVTVRPLPQVNVLREYKKKWLKYLSVAEKKKYKNINTP